MKISILIPVFNAAGGLEHALESISSQGCSCELEIVAVDDSSTDSSTEILTSFKQSFETIRGRQMKIIRHESNQGVAAARNTALDEASGEYILWLDADDKFETGAIRKIEQALTNADIIGWDWTLWSLAGSRYMRQPDCANGEEALKALLGGTLRWNLWLFATRRELFDGVRFNPGMNMGEDMAAMTRLFIKARSFIQIHEALYLYRQTSISISKTMSEDNLRQTCANVELASAAVRSSAYSYLEQPYLDLLKLNAKLPLLVSKDKNDYLRWLDCYPEASRSILKNPHLPMRTKLLQLAASKRMWIAVRIYNELVYGLLYKALACRNRS